MNEEFKAKIAALLRKAASTEHEAEREAFEAKAETLMLRHGLTEADLHDDQTGIEQLVFGLENWGPAVVGVIDFITLLGELQGVFVVFGHEGPESVGVVAFGRPARLAWLDARLDVLLPQLKADIIRDRPASMATYAATWGWAVVKRIKATQDQAERHFRAETGAAGALVPTVDTAREHATDKLDIIERESDVDRSEHKSLLAGMIGGLEAELGDPALRESQT